MHISGPEPSSLFLSQKKLLKIWEVVQKSAKQGTAIRDGLHVIHPQYYNFNEFYTRKIWWSKRYESTAVDWELGYMCPRGTCNQDIGAINSF